MFDFIMDNPFLFVLVVMLVLGSGIGGLAYHVNSECGLHAMPNAARWVNTNYPGARVNETGYLSVFDVIPANAQVQPFSILCGCGADETCQLYVRNR